MTITREGDGGKEAVRVSLRQKKCTVFALMLGVPALLLAVLMGLSRLYVGVHYPTDVLVGLLSGLVLSVAAEKMVDASEAGGGIRDMWRGRRR